MTHSAPNPNNRAVAACIQSYLSQRGWSRQILVNAGKGDTVILHSTPIFVDAFEALQDDLKALGVSPERDYESDALIAYIDTDNFDTNAFLQRFKEAKRLAPLNDRSR